MDFEHFMRNSVKFHTLYLSQNPKEGRDLPYQAGVSPSLRLASVSIKYIKTSNKKSE